MKFKVRDKDHVLGVVILSINRLGCHREASKKWHPLMAHKKGHEPSGDLLVECFVSKYRPGQVVSLSEASSPITSRMGSQEDILNPKFKGRRFSLHRRTPSWTKGSSGNLELPSAKREDPSSETSATTSIHSESSAEIASKTPQVTGISPHEGSVQGGQRVVLRGSNLGESKASIVKVMLADVDCTSSLEYFSPSETSNP